MKNSSKRAEIGSFFEKFMKKYAKMLDKVREKLYIVYRKFIEKEGVVEKKITSVGKCAGIILNKLMLELSGMQIGDYVEITCSKNKITIKKKGE